VKKEIARDMNRWFQYNSKSKLVESQMIARSNPVKQIFRGRSIN